MMAKVRRLTDDTAVVAPTARPVPGSFGSRNGRKQGDANRRADRPHHTEGAAYATTTLSIAVLLRAIEAQECPWCGRGPFKSLALHTHIAHGVGARELRDMAELPASAPLCAPEVSARSRTILLGRADFESISRRGLDAAHSVAKAAQSTPFMRRGRARGARVTSEQRKEQYRPRFEEAERLFMSTDMTLTQIGDRVGLHPSTISRKLTARGMDVETRVTEQRAVSAWTKPSLVRAAEARRIVQETAREELIARFRDLGETWNALVTMADERSVSRKSMAESLRNAGARVPDGRQHSALRGRAGGRTYVTTPKRKCTEDGCDGDVIARGMCRKHYQRWARSGGSARGDVRP